MPDARGNFKGVALNGKASESWERIFGVAGSASEPLTEGAFIRAMEAEVRGGWEQVRRDDERMLRGHYGDPAPEGAGSDED